MRASLIVLFLSACGASTRIAPQVPPTSRDVMLALSAHADLDPPDPSCTNVTGDLADERLGTIQAHLIAQLVDAQAEGDLTRMTASCQPAGPPWRCLFEVSILAEDPWTYGIAFDLDRTGAIDPRTIRCPGGS